MIRVFIAMPYGDHNRPDIRLDHTRDAMDQWHMLADAGFVPFCPLLSHFLHEHRPRPRAEWLHHSAAWLDACNCVLAIGESEGVEAEVALARSLCLPVFDSLDDLLAAYGRSFG